jgi:hypothetical protein
MISLTDRLRERDMHWEPILPTSPVPQGGWPRSLMRLHLAFDCPIAEAIYEVACASRQFRRGVVMDIGGQDLFAYPHQSCDEVARTWARLNRQPESQPMTETTDTQAEAPIKRWTALRKATLVADIALGRTSAAEACERHGLSQEELGGWMDGYHEHGLRGLMATKVQAFR